MYPFKTDERTIISDLTGQEIKAYLERHIEKKRLIQFTYDSLFYGVVKEGYARFEMGQFPTRNSCRPVAIIT